MAGIREVAAKAGVSPSTVSRAINGSGYISEASRLAIEAAISELDYVPNELVGNLFQKKTLIVGVVLPDIYHPFFAAMLQCLERELYKHGYKTMLCNTVLESNRERDYIHMLQRHVVDGIILGSHTLDVSEYERLKMPIVTLDHCIKPHIPNFCANHWQGGVMAAERLLQGGCRRAIQITDSSEYNTDTPYLRHISFVEAFEQGGGKVANIRHGKGIYQYADFLDIAREIVQSRRDFDAVFSVDLMAAAMLHALRESGRHVPEEVQIVGYDGCMIPYITTPRLTSIVQPIEAQARQIVDNLLHLIRGEQDQLDMAQLQVSLYQGETTRLLSPGQADPA